MVMIHFEKPGLNPVKRLADPNFGTNRNIFLCDSDKDATPLRSDMKWRHLGLRSVLKSDACPQRGAVWAAKLDGEVRSSGKGGLQGPRHDDQPLAGCLESVFDFGESLHA